MHDMRVTRAYDALVTAMEKPEHLHLIMEFQGKEEGDLPKVHKAWKRLKAAHVVHADTNYLHVSREMADLAMERGENVTQYWARSQDIKERCHEAGVPMPTRSHLAAVLNGLPRSWDTIVQLESRRLKKLTEDRLLASLLEEEHRRGIRKGKDKEHGGDAFYG